MDLIVLGTSFKFAPVEVREKFALSETEVAEFLPRLLAIEGISECAIISTCNRTELYLAADNGFDTGRVSHALTEFKAAGEFPEKSFYIHKSAGAIRHLFQVISGLDSQALGENQVQGQVKTAYILACRAGTAGAYLNKLFHSTFKVGKAVRSETGLGAGAVSISSAAVELANCVYGELKGRRALVVGAGETAELVASHLIDRGIYSLSVANRTRENAEDFASRFRADIVDYTKVATAFFENDIVVSATSSPGYVITSKTLKPGFKENSSRKVVAIDIAIPRDIEPQIAAFKNVFLYDMDDLETIVDKNMEERRREIPKAGKIIERVVAEYEKWMKGQKVVPTIKYLQGRFEEIRASEMERSRHCSACDKRTHIDELTKRIVTKILRAPIAKLINDTKCSEDELEYLRAIFSEEGKK